MEGGGGWVMWGSPPCRFHYRLDGGNFYLCKRLLKGHLCLRSNSVSVDSVFVVANVWLHIIYSYSEEKLSYKIVLSRQFSIGSIRMYCSIIYARTFIKRSSSIQYLTFVTWSLLTFSSIVLPPLLFQCLRETTIEKYILSNTIHFSTS